MKKFYLLFLMVALARLTGLAQVRYLNEVFTTWQYAKDSIYGNNFQVLTGTPIAVPLKCDIYQPPASDTVSKRPLIIMLHTGSFLPKYLNQGPTGYKDDSATIEIARGFAKRGYVVCVPAYRQGWNPAASTQEARAASIMQAVYRAEQDAKAAVRYMKLRAAAYKIDVNKVVMGGQGTGGYIALTYAYVHSNAETRYSKFIGTGGLPFIDTAALGDIDNLLTGTMGTPNNPGVSSDINMIFTLGGAIGDITWMNTGEIPVVGMHSWSDPFAPDTSGIVTVPGTPPQAVIPVDGSRNICRKAVQLALQPWKNCQFSDPYSVAAAANNEGISGYYRFRIPYPAPYVYQAAPWEWWDSATTVGIAYLTYKAIGTPDTTALKNAKACNANGLATNQFMSKTKALAYIDTIQNYLAPRIMVALHLPGYLGPCPQGGVGVSNPVKETSAIEVYPNPAKGMFTIKATGEIKNIILTDISGRVILNQEHNGLSEISINRNDISNGIYFLRVVTSKGDSVQRLILE
ncbi:MAG: T9SS type A sorting domain-containing protein [Bacteroidetes bacterium]|nr:T9SS type A sorting domain-containing protein [Bacteroidota bacterium]